MCTTTVSIVSIVGNVVISAIVVVINTVAVVAVVVVIHIIAVAVINTIAVVSWRAVEVTTSEKVVVDTGGIAANAVEHRDGVG